jgi:Holliday junction resolvasome RuvABC endonuclease subunit
MLILGLDPGSSKTGWVALDTQSGQIVGACSEKGGHQDNDRVLELVTKSDYDLLAIEKITLYQRVNNHIHDTIFWYGRFVQAWGDRPLVLVPRHEVYKHLCPGIRGANDSAVIAALKDLLGGTGSKKQPGATFGVTGHSWQALAVAMVGQSLSSAVSMDSEKAS